MYAKVVKKMKKKPFESTTGEEGDAVALTNVRNDNFPDMKKWIKGFFDHELLVSHNMISSNPHCRKFIFFSL